MLSKIRKHKVWNRQKKEIMIEKVNYLALYQAWLPKHAKRTVSNRLRVSLNCGKSGAVSDPARLKKFLETYGIDTSIIKRIPDVDPETGEPPTLDFVVSQFTSLNDLFTRQLKPNTYATQFLHNLAEMNKKESENVICSLATCRLSIFDISDPQNMFRQHWIKNNQFTVFQMLVPNGIAHTPANVISMWNNLHPGANKMLLREVVQLCSLNPREQKRRIGKLLNQIAIEEQKYGNYYLVVFRLAPEDYHRFHSPVSGTVIYSKTLKPKSHYTYASVQPIIVNKQGTNVYITNYRKVARINSKNFGTLYMTAIGATCVNAVQWYHIPLKQYLKTDSITKMVNPKTGIPVRSKMVPNWSPGDQTGFFAYGGSTVTLIVPKTKNLSVDSDILQRTQNKQETLVHLGEILFQKK